MWGKYDSIRGKGIPRQLEWGGIQLGQISPSHEMTLMSNRRWSRSLTLSTQAPGTPCSLPPPQGQCSIPSPLTLLFIHLPCTLVTDTLLCYYISLFKIPFIPSFFFFPAGTVLMSTTEVLETSVHVYCLSFHSSMDDLY